MTSLFPLAAFEQALAALTAPVEIFKAAEATQESGFSELFSELAEPAKETKEGMAPESELPMPLAPPVRKKQAGLLLALQVVAEPIVLPAPMSAEARPEAPGLTPSTSPLPQFEIAAPAAVVAPTPPQNPEIIAAAPEVPAPTPATMEPAAWPAAATVQAAPKTAVSAPPTNPVAQFEIAAAPAAVAPARIALRAAVQPVETPGVVDVEADAAPEVLHFTAPASPAPPFEVAAPAAVTAPAPPQSPQTTGTAPETPAPVAMPVQIARPAHLAFEAKLTPVARKSAEPPATAPKMAESTPAAEPATTLPAVKAATPAKSEPDSEQPPPDSLLASGPRPVQAAPPEAAPSHAAPSYVVGEPAPAAKVEETRAPEPAERPQPMVLHDREPVKAPAIARDIRLELKGDDQRVELRVTERAGEVRVAVRTPDSRLAMELRENLPTLSTRLEQTGYRTEAVHAAAAQQAEVSRQVEGPSASHHRPKDEHSGQDPRERRNDSPQDQPQQRKQKGKEFEWLMSSLR